MYNDIRSMTWNKVGRDVRECVNCRIRCMVSLNTETMIQRSTWDGIVFNIECAIEENINNK